MPPLAILTVCAAWLKRQTELFSIFRMESIVKPLNGFPNGEGEVLQLTRTFPFIEERGY